MLLTIDVGNSDTVFAFYKDNQWQNPLRVATLPNESPLFYQKALVDHFLESRMAVEQVSGVVLSSVVPKIRLMLTKLLTDFFQQVPVVVGPDIYDQLPLRIIQTQQIGTDLVANAMAAHRLIQRNCIVVDFGTALSFTTVHQSGEILGVNIAPGLKTAIKSLVGSTAQLPEVPLRIPSSVLGKDTVTAIQSGVLIGYIGLVRHQLASIRAELSGNWVAVATGGLSSIIPALKNDFDRIDRNWTNEGLRLIYEAVTENG